jgi:hypothetical protein
MPCKIQIKENLTNEISVKTDNGFNRSLEGAKALAKEVNTAYGANVVSFYQTYSDFIERNINIPNSLIDTYYNNELTLEKTDAIDKTVVTKLTTLDELEKNKSFQNTLVEFVSEIPTNRDVPVAFRNVNKGEKFLFVKDLFQQKFNEKAWTKPAVLSDGSEAQPLAENQFKSINEFLTFALLHEKAHEYIFKEEGESIGEYEDRINQEALRRMSNVMLKPGVQELFDSNPELSNIGTPQQYSQYIDSIFPDSKVKDIVYHGTPYGGFEKFNIEATGKITGTSTKGIYFTDSKKTATFYAENLIDFSSFESREEYELYKTDQIYSVILNAKELKLVDSPQAQEKQGDAILRTKTKISDIGLTGYTADLAHQYIVFNPEQIHILGNKQDVEGFKNFVAKPGEQLTMFQQEGPTVSSKASPKTIAIVNDFLKRIGVNIQSVKKVVVNGVELDANAVANITQALVQVVEGKESQSLPEEAMHFAVEIIKQTNPALYKKLLSEINSYTTLKDVFAEYSTNPAYQTADGKPNVTKLKDEAIGKVLAEVIINQSEGITEKPELLVKAQSWWNQILDFLKGLFTTSGFDQLAMDILSGKDIGTAEDIKEGGVFFQLSKQEEIYNNIKELSSKIKKEDDGYSINGKKITRRVSNLVADWYERRFKNKDLTKTEYQTAVDDLKAEKGTAGHADIEYAFGLFVNEDGLLRSYDEIENILKNDNHTSLLNPEDSDMYVLLRNNLLERLRSFPDGTKFMSEATIYDAKRDIAGTVDFLAITPEGKVNILDWKFMDLNIDKYTDIPWYKVNAWNTQMDQYKYIISKVYNVKNENFEQTRMIPIKAIYSQGNAKTKVLPKLLSIKIGDVNVKNIEEDYLIPVGLQAEKTGVEEIDTLVEKLNAIYKKLSETKALPSEKQSKAEQLNALFSAIRQLQMKQNIAPLIYQAKVLNKQVQDVINKYNSQFKGKDPKSLTTDQISEFAETIETSREALETYIDLDTQLDFLFEDRELSEEDEQLQKALGTTAKEARKYNKELKEVDKKFTNDIIGGSEGVKGLSSPEKIVRGITKFFGNTATIQLKGLETLFKKANRAFAFAGMDTLSEVKKLTTLKDAYQKWATSKGLTIKNMFNMIKKEGKNELIDEFNPEFYKDLKSAINKDSRDVAWIKDNVDQDAYKEHLKQKLEEELSRIDNKPRVGTEEQNEADINREKSKAKELYSVTTDQSPGWLLYDEINKFPKRDKWESEAWKQLHKPENKPALDFYNYIKERNEYYKEIGYINAKQARTFLPWVRKGLSEKLIFGGKISLGEQFLRNISLDESDAGYGQIDPLTGKPIDTIPTYFTTALEDESEASTDLFKSMALYNEFAIKFKYLSDIEAQGRALIRLEKNKNAIATSQFGKTEYKDGVLQYNPDNSENTKLIESMVKAIVYQQKYIESESFDQLLGKFGKFGKVINDKLGMNLLPENLENRQISINKVITQMNNTFQLNALGLNVLSSASNLFGGKTQSLINSGKYFTKSDYVSAEMWLLANKMGGEDKQKMLAALDYFLPFTENYNRDAARKLSLNKVDDQAIQDFLMVLMREGERAVQTTNFFAYIRNSAVVNGEVVNAREYLKSTDEYKDFYAGTQSERNSRAEKFEKDVKELVANQGVLKLGTVKDGEFVIPGVEQKSNGVVETRRKIQQFTSDALGSLTEENKRLINMTVYGNSFMVFKNWIPRLVDVRMGNLKYNAASDAYEWGRSRMLFRIISEDLLGSINILKNSILGVTSDKDLDTMRKLFEKKKADYENDTGKTLEMTESEFIDLVKQNIKNQLLDTLVYAGLFALTLGLKALPDDDDDPIVKNQYKFLLKATDKFKDELGYFYNPTNLTQLVSTGFFPSVGLLKNYANMVTKFLTENYAIATGNEELEDKNFVIKYWMRGFPISSQAAGLLPMFYPELAKDLGIKMQSQYGIK